MDPTVTDLLMDEGDTLDVLFGGGSGGGRTGGVVLNGTAAAISDNLNQHRAVFISLNNDNTHDQNNTYDAVYAVSYTELYRIIKLNYSDHTQFIQPMRFWLILQLILLGIATLLLTTFLWSAWFRPLYVGFSPLPSSVPEIKTGLTEFGGYERRERSFFIWCLIWLIRFELDVIFDISLCLYRFRAIQKSKDWVEQNSSSSSSLSAASPNDDPTSPLLSHLREDISSNGTANSRRRRRRRRLRRVVAVVLGPNQTIDDFRRQATTTTATHNSTNEGTAAAPAPAAAADVEAGEQETHSPAPVSPNRLAFSGTFVEPFAEAMVLKYYFRRWPRKLLNFVKVWMNILSVIWTVCGAVILIKFRGAPTDTRVGRIIAVWFNAFFAMDTTALSLMLVAVALIVCLPMWLLGGNRAAAFAAAQRGMGGRSTPEAILKKLRRTTYETIVGEIVSESKSANVVPSVSGPGTSPPAIGTLATMVAPSSAAAYIFGTVSQDDIESQAIETACGICWNNYMPNDTLVVLPCNKRHFFHEKCIIDWLKREVFCPICREDMAELGACLT